jgi:hypothetical protein
LKGTLREKEFLLNDALFCSLKESAGFSRYLMAKSWRGAELCSLDRYEYELVQRSGRTRLNFLCYVSPFQNLI